MTKAAYREYELMVSITDVRVWPDEDGAFPEAGKPLQDALDDAVREYLNGGGSLMIVLTEIVACAEYDEDGEEIAP